MSHDSQLATGGRGFSSYWFHSSRDTQPDLSIVTLYHNVSRSGTISWGAESVRPL